ncbi:MAG: hypothetical protein U0871_14695 [Gemmataceae bacterium]
MSRRSSALPCYRRPTANLRRRPLAAPPPRKRTPPRVVPAVYDNTFTLTDGISGGTATVRVTVNEAADGLYDWNYHLVNGSVDYAQGFGSPSPIGIGFFGLFVYPGVVVPSSVEGPAGWEV